MQSPIWGPVGCYPYNSFHNLGLLYPITIQGNASRMPLAYQICSYFKVTHSYENQWKTWLIFIELSLISTLRLAALPSNTYGITVNYLANHCVVDCIDYVYKHWDRHPEEIRGSVYHPLLFHTTCFLCPCVCVRWRNFWWICSFIYFDQLYLLKNYSKDYWSGT